MTFTRGPGRPARPVSGLLRLSFAFLLAAAFSGLFPVPAAAATLTATPNGDGTTALTLFGAATHWQAVLTNDGDTTYVGNTTGASKSDLFTLDTSTVTVSGKGKINSVTVYMVAMRSGTGGTVAAYLQVNANTTTGTAKTLTASYAPYSEVRTTSPSGGEWTWQNIRNLQIGVTLVKGRATQVYAVIDYTPASAATYRDAGFTTLWGRNLSEPYDATYKTVYVYGSSFSSSYNSYHVAYYDANSFPNPNLKADNAVSSDASGNLSDWYSLDTDPNAIAGTWRAVVFDTAIGSPPSTYAAGAGGAIVDIPFEVLNGAIPEFPAVIASILVAGLCFITYWQLRKKSAPAGGSCN